MKFKTLLSTGLTCGILMNLLPVVANASTEVSIETKQFTSDVTIPTSLAMIFNADGTSVVPTLPIQNDMNTFDVKLNSITADFSTSDWSPVNSGSSFDVLDAKNIALGFNVTDSGFKTFNVTDSNTSVCDNLAIAIKPSEKFDLNLEVEKASFTTSSSTAKAFTLEFDYDIVNTGDDVPSVGDKHTITFDSDGGDSVESKSAVTGEVIDLPVLSKSDKKFGGWLSSDGNVYNGTFTVGASDDALVAQWYTTYLMDDYSLSYSIGSSVASTVTEVKFIKGLLGIDFGYDNSWDLSVAKNGTVTAYLKNNILYIASPGAVSLPVDCSGLFKNFTSLTSIDFSNVVDTSRMTTLREMFYNCSSLVSLDLSGFDTSSVKSMSDTFYACRALTSLDLSGWDTSNVTTMLSMFDNCKSLPSLDVSNFNTSKVTSMKSMFASCAALTSLDLSNFDTTKVTDMKSMFEYAYNLSEGSITISGTPTTYTSLFNGTGMKNTGSGFTVNYVAGFESTASILVDAKSTSATVKLGSLVTR